MPPEDDVLLAEEQPLPVAVSPTADSPSYITKSDLEVDPEEDDKDPEEDPANYPDDRDDDEEEESSKDDANNEKEDEDEDEEGEEEHLAPADSVLPLRCRTTVRMSIRDQTHIPFPPAVDVDRFLAISTTPPSPLTSYSSPLPHIPSLPLPSPSTPHPLPLPSPIVLPHTRASVDMMRAATRTTYILASRPETPPSGTPPHLPIPLPTPLLHLLLPSTDCRAGVSEVRILPRKRLCIALGLRFKVGKSLSAPTARPTGGFRADYRFVGTLDDEIRQDPERENTDEIYGRLNDAQDDRSLMICQLNMPRRDRCTHARTARLMESKAILSYEAWLQSMDASDTARSETQMAVLQSQQTPSRKPTRPEIPEKMAPKRTTRSTPATTTTLTTSVTDEKLKRLVDQGVADALAARDADKSRNG
ncbi:hypothetical protein Tco_1152554 [Tanacetum coccineum]